MGPRRGLDAMVSPVLREERAASAKRDPRADPDEPPGRQSAPLAPRSLGRITLQRRAVGIAPGRALIEELPPRTDTLRGARPPRAPSEGVWCCRPEHRYEFIDFDEEEPD